MVNPIKNQPPGFIKNSPKKKAAKEIDQRIKKAVNKTAPIPEKASSPVKASLKLAAKQAYQTAEKAYNAASQRAFKAKREALKAQKAAFLAQRAHMAQQLAAANRAQIAEAAKKEAEKAAKKAADLRKILRVQAFLERSREKKQKRPLKKQAPSSQKKKKNP